MKWELEIMQTVEDTDIILRLMRERQIQTTSHLGISIYFVFTLLGYRK